MENAPIFTVSGQAANITITPPTGGFIALDPEGSIYSRPLDLVFEDAASHVGEVVVAKFQADVLLAAGATAGIFFDYGSIVNGALVRRSMIGNSILGPPGTHVPAGAANVARSLDIDVPWLIQEQDLDVDGDLILRPLVLHADTGFPAQILSAVLNTPPMSTGYGPWPRRAGLKIATEGQSFANVGRYPEQLRRILRRDPWRLSVQLDNMAASGTTFDQRVGGAAYQYWANQLSYESWLCIQWGSFEDTKPAGGNLEAAAVLTKAETAANLMKTYGCEAVIQMTQPQSGEHQGDATWEARRVAWNDLLKAYSGTAFDEIVDVEEIPEFLDPDDYTDIDGIHFTVAAGLLVAEKLAPVVARHYNR